MSLLHFRGARALLKNRFPPSHHVDSDDETDDAEDLDSDSLPTPSDSAYSAQYSPKEDSGIVAPLPILIPLAPSASPLPSFIPLTPSISTPLRAPSTMRGQFASPQASPTAKGSAKSPSSISSASQSNDGQKKDVTSGASHSGGSMPVAAIVGTALALIAFAVTAIFLYRKKSRKGRKRLRDWIDVEDSSRISPWVDYREKVIDEPKPAVASFKDRTAPRMMNWNRFSRSPRPFANIDIPTPTRDLGLPTPIVGAARVFPFDVPEYAKVMSTFIPALPDELSINTGDSLRVLAEFDDGWALCQNARGEKGMVPMECLDQADAPSVFQGPGVREERKSSRISSLAAAPYDAYT